MRHYIILLIMFALSCQSTTENKSTKQSTIDTQSSIEKETQTDLSQKASATYEESDKHLNTVYQTLISDYKDDALFLKNLKESQRLWVQFRDAELALKYPEYGGASYGSSISMCKSTYLKELTDKRVSTLRIWVNGIAEGDVCAGSVKLN